MSLPQGCTKDILKKDDDKWRFTHRRLEVDLVEDQLSNDKNVSDINKKNIVNRPSNVG